MLFSGGVRLGLQDVQCTNLPADSSAATSFVRNAHSNNVSSRCRFDLPRAGRQEGQLIKS